MRLKLHQVVKIDFLIFYALFEDYATASVIPNRHVLTSLVKRQCTQNIILVDPTSVLLTQAGQVSNIEAFRNFSVFNYIIYRLLLVD